MIDLIPIVPRFFWGLIMLVIYLAGSNNRKKNKSRIEVCKTYCSPKIRRHFGHGSSQARTGTIYFLRTVYYIGGIWLVNNNCQLVD